MRIRAGIADEAKGRIIHAFASNAGKKICKNHVIQPVPASFYRETLGPLYLTPVLTKTKNLAISAN